MKLSMGLRAQARLRTSGTAGRFTGLNDQWTAAMPPAGMAAPESIQVRMVSICAAVRGGPAGGMRKAGLSLLILL